MDRRLGRLKPSSLSRYVATLRMVLDFAGVDPNPARDKRVKLPRIEGPRRRAAVREGRRHHPRDRPAALAATALRPRGDGGEGRGAPRPRVEGCRPR